MLAPDAISVSLEALPDDQLTLAYVGGDTSAFDLLYARHESALYRFVRRLLGIRLAPEADEVFQETWTRIISERESFSPQGIAWRTWAFTVAHTLAIERLRISGHEVAFYAHDEDGDGLEAARLFSRGLLQGGSESADASSPSMEELAFWRAAGRRLLACLNELPEDQRAAFLLRHEAGFTLEVLETTLDVDIETVRSRLRFGLKKLRACMERYLSVVDADADEGADDLHDRQVWRALEHAPDHSVVPDWRLRKGILRRAYDAVGALDPEEAEAELERAAHSGWGSVFVQRGRGKGSRLLRSAAVVAVLLAVVALFFLQRDPVPIPRPVNEARVVAPTPQAEQQSNTLPLSGDIGSVNHSAPLAELAQPAEPASAPVSIAPQPTPRPEPPRPATAENQRAGSPLPPTKPAPVPPSNTVARLVLPDSPPGTPPKGAETSAPRPADAPPPPAAPAASRPSSSSVRTEATDPPTFAALSQWSRITISRRGGESHSFSREEARDLNALLGSAAISAVGAQTLKAAPEWRVSLERKGEVLAVFEIAGSQVRWREGKTPPATGMPSSPSLSALRDALSHAVQQPEASAAPESPQTP